VQSPRDMCRSAIDKSRRTRTRSVFSSILTFNMHDANQSLRLLLNISIIVFVTGRQSEWIQYIIILKSEKNFATRSVRLADNDNEIFEWTVL